MRLISKDLAKKELLLLGASTLLNMPTFNSILKYILPCVAVQLSKSICSFIFSLLSIYPFIQLTHMFLKHSSRAYFKPGTMMALGIENQIRHEHVNDYSNQGDPQIN